MPASVTYVAVDFASQALGEQLAGSGFRSNVPSFFSWLGVTMYLEPQAVFATLRWIATGTAPGSGVVFDYAISRARLDWFERLVYWGMSKRVAAVGEPWRATFDPQTLSAQLNELGFTHVEDLRSHAIDARYFANRADGLRVGTLAALVSART